MQLRCIIIFICSLHQINYYGIVMAETGTCKANQVVWKFIVGLRRGTTIRPFCVGTLISADCVVTAAHCLYEPSSNSIVDPSLIQVIGGSLDYRNAVYTSTIADAQLHPEYQHAQLLNDVAVIRLKSPMGKMATVDYAILSKQNSTFDNCRYLHWGTYPPRVGAPKKFDGDPHDYNSFLFHTKNKTQCDIKSLGKPPMSVPMWKDDECGQKYPNATHKNKVFCAYEGGLDDKKYLKESCQLDSGSPLICLESYPQIENATALKGITSWGCGINSHPGVYPLVPQYTKWIEDICNLTFAQQIELQQEQKESIKNSKASSFSNHYIICIQIFILLRH